MIKLQVIGTIGKDAESKNVNGNTVINFSVAVNEKRKGVEKTTWVDCGLWMESEKVIEYLKKGAQLYVEGYPEINAYASNGEVKSSLRIKVGHFEIVKFANDKIPF